MRNELTGSPPRPRVDTALDRFVHSPAVTRLLPWLLLLSLAGCAATGPTIQVGFVELDPRDRPTLAVPRGTIRLTGPIGQELRALPGARVKVWGRAVASALRVSHYQVLDAGGGFQAYVGFIVVDQVGVRLVEWLNGREWRLVGPELGVLREQHGAKVWLTGLEEGPDEIRPLGWGRVDGG